MLTRNFLLSLTAAAAFLAAGVKAATTCPANSSLVGSKCVCDSGYYSGGTNGDGSLARCYPVCSPNYYPNLNSASQPTGGCSACPLFSTSTGLTKSCTCAASNPVKTTNGPGQVTSCGCPANSKLSGSDCVCNAGYRSGGTNADGTLKRCYPVCSTNQYPQLNNDGSPTGSCVACPSYSTSSGTTDSCTCQAGYPVASTTAAGQVAECGCPDNASKVSGVCTCNSGYYTGSTNPDGSLRFCYNVCPANTYPNVQDNSYPASGGGCSACPARSTSTGLTKTCTCDEHTTTGPTNPAGQPSSCSACESPYVDSADGTQCVLPPSPALRAVERAKRQLALQRPLSLCPSGLEACSIGTSLSGGYECVSLQDELEHCGACHNSCLNIIGANGVACSGGACEVISCQAGFDFVAADNGSCRPTTSKKRRRQRKKSTIA